MKQLLCRLSDDQYDVLRALAFEERTSMAELVRRAVEKTYHEDLEDLRDALEELAAHKADPTSSIDFEEFQKELLGGVPDPDTAEGRKATA